MTTTEILLYIQGESNVSRVSKVIFGKELKKENFFQKRLKIKGKVARYWAVKKIEEKLLVGGTCHSAVSTSRFWSRICVLTSRP